jgi:hypothetical protein
MFQLPRSRPRAGEGCDQDERLGSTPLASPPGGDPGELAFYRIPDWQPVPSGYDWYGRVDPEGLVDDPDPLGRAMDPTTPPGEAE